MLDTILTTKQAAGYLGIGYSTILKWRGQGLGPPYLSRGAGALRPRWGYLLSDLDFWLAQRPGFDYTSHDNPLRRYADRPIVDGEVLLSLSDARIMLNLTGRCSLNRLRRTRRIPFYKIGKGRTARAFYKRADLEAWLNKPSWGEPWVKKTKKEPLVRYTETRLPEDHPVVPGYPPPPPIVPQWRGPSWQNRP